MNAGVISMRYARALLKLVADSGRGQQVCAQMRAMLSNPDEIPDPLEKDIESLIKLLVKNGREDLTKDVFRSFVKIYLDSEGIKLATLVTAVPAPGLSEKLSEMVFRQTGFRIILESSVDPSIIGGFILTFDDKMLDASVRRSIEIIRKEFIQDNSRIV